MPWTPYNAAMQGRRFIKMHGLGNDFVVVDARSEPFALSATAARRVADRRLGVGCDQLILIEPPRNGKADAFMRILNADGSQAEACGNATRCVASLLIGEKGQPACVIETLAGLLAVESAPNGAFSADMGPVHLEWQDIPLAREADTCHLPLSLGELADPVGVNIGNPHAVFFVPAAEAVPLAELGPKLEHDPLFPRRANISVAAVTGEDRLRLRVWERGVGITQACGSGACAAAVAAHRRGLTGRRVAVDLDGGTLAIEWRADGHVVKTGPAATVFTGTLNGALLV